MKLLFASLLFSQLPLYVYLLLIPWTVDKEKLAYQKERDPPLGASHREPTLEYEQLRRRIKKNVIDFWHLFSSELDDIQKSVAKFSPELALRIVTVIQLGREYQRALRSDLDMLQMTDGYTAWREREAAELSELMQNRLIHLQNPKDCRFAPKAVVSLVDRGYGCDLHLLVLRFIIAYATNRTLVVDSRNWCYNKGGWDVVFYPFSDTCTDVNGTSYAHWPRASSAQVVFLSSVSPRAPFFPRSVPADLAPRLKRLHGNPFAWWVGQFFKYILRPRNNMAKMVEAIAERGGLKRPYVGVHIPRMDKNLEEKHIPLEKYMAEVDEFYEALQLTQEVPVRRIYLATEDPKVISEIEMKYKNRYDFFNNTVVANSAASFETGFNKASLMGITLDTFFLSLSDYLVCTFTSNICRAAYEIMQIFHPDASDKAYSLNKLYFYDNELDGTIAAEYRHRAHSSGEISFNVGDEISDVMDLMNGYSTGIHQRTKNAGWFPSFKVSKMLKTFNFPTYPDVIANEIDKK